MTLIPMTLDRAVAGLVELPTGKHVAVISAHFKCCGYASSDEDNLRIQQAEQIVGEIKRMREGEIGEKAKDAPIVVIGDYKLVGSRKPLDVLNKAGLADFLMRSPIDGSAYTWRELDANKDQAFWPGRLDFVTHGPRLKPLRGLVLDTAKLSADELKTLALHKEDSRASDHLLLICDF